MAGNVAQKPSFDSLKRDSFMLNIACDVYTTVCDYSACAQNWIMLRLEKKV